MYRQYDLEGLVHHTDEVVEVTRKTSYLRMLVRTTNSMCVALRRRNKQLKDGVEPSKVKSSIPIGMFALPLDEKVPNWLHRHMRDVIKVLADHRALVEIEDYDFEFEGQPFKAPHLIVESLDDIDQVGLLGVQLDARRRLRARM